MDNAINNNTPEDSGDNQLLEINNKKNVLSSLLSTGEGKLMILIIIGFVAYITAILTGRFFFLSSNIEYGPILLDRVYQGFPLDYKMTG